MVGKTPIFIFLCLFLCNLSQGYSETYLADYFEVTNDVSLNKEAFLIDKELQSKYQIVAKQFAKKGATQTSVVTYETTSNGVHVHIGWYVDGFIATALDGSEAGKQVIVVNDSVVGISYHITFCNGYFIHKYIWGTVSSYSNKQILKTK